ncbi:MAG: type I-A CRISPR-associated protein Cas5 [Desulfurococcales archaeon ex4484_217_2]|nr:MAG: type I-A CRISPR-associated protein Cas5 [Desulfurococcales archaeon ex4484_217_2]
MQSNLFFLLKVKLAVSWGLVSRVTPFSKSRRVLKYPPPTTLIGALSYPINYFLKKPENISHYLSSANILKGVVVSAHASLNASATIVGDINRVYWYHLARKMAKTDAVALEKIYLTCKNGLEFPILNVIYVIDPEKMRKVLDAQWDSVLKALAWSINRIGQKESMVSVVDVSTAKAAPLNLKVIETSYYIPFPIVESIIEGEYTIENYVPPVTDIGEYTGVPRIPYIIPYSFIKSNQTRVKLKVKENAVVLKINGEYVAFPKEWIMEGG